jgi:hypothetical protein
MLIIALRSLAGRTSLYLRLWHCDDYYEFPFKTLALAYKANNSYLILHIFTAERTGVITQEPIIQAHGMKHMSARSQSVSSSLLADRAIFLKFS